jgi:hypothetical protein
LHKEFWCVNLGRKRLLGRRRRRWEDNIQRYLQEEGWGGGTDRIDLVEDRYRLRAGVTEVMNIRVP